MKPKFKLRQYRNLDNIIGLHLLHWEMVEGDPFYSAHRALFNRPISRGSVISMDPRDFWRN